MPTPQIPITTAIADLTARDAGPTLAVAVAAMAIGGLLYLATDQAADLRRPVQRVLCLGLGCLMALGLANGLAHLLPRLTGGA